MINKIKNLIHSLRKTSNFDDISFKIGCSHFNIMKNFYPKIRNFSDTSYKVYSQNGEDGFIDYLLFTLKIDKPKFIEIGIGTYKECNTRFLFERMAPEGLVIDYINDLEKKIKKNIKFWKGDLTIVNQIINTENIVDILRKNNFLTDIDLFSLDIDGIDYWILEKIPDNFSKICVIEYNSIFGDQLEITVPNIKDFNRKDYHFSYLCYGMSLKALIKKMDEKGFIFVGSNELNNNAFFIQKKYSANLNIEFPDINNLKKFTVSNIRESRDKNENLNYLSKEERLKAIENCEVIDVSNKKNEKIKIKDLLNKQN
jgi:hypothetical protein